ALSEKAGRSASNCCDYDLCLYKHKSQATKHDLCKHDLCEKDLYERDAMTFSNDSKYGDRSNAANLNAVMEDDSQSLPDSGSSTSTSVLEKPEVDESAKMDDGGDADRFAHYVSKDRVIESRLTGRPVVALCGKVWIPKREANDYPVCPECKKIYEEMNNLGF
ncbi:hypothetical protein HMPREF1577_01311, partial [Gardnerella pickettii JCP8017A]